MTEPKILTSKFLLFFLFRTPWNPEDLNKFGSILEDLIKEEDSLEFRHPVDYEGLGIWEYPFIIKTPMDLGTIKKNLNSRKYKFLEEAIRDLQLTWDNCKIFNNEDSDIYGCATRLEMHSHKYLKSSFPSLYSSKSINIEPQERTIIHKDSQQILNQETELKDVVIPPTPAIFDDENVPYYEKLNFSHNIHKLTPENLEKLVNLLDVEAPTCLKEIERDRLQIHVDNIPMIVFRRANGESSSGNELTQGLRILQILNESPFYSTVLLTPYIDFIVDAKDEDSTNDSKNSEEESKEFSFEKFIKIVSECENEVVLSIYNLHERKIRTVKTKPAEKEGRKTFGLKISLETFENCLNLSFKVLHVQSDSPAHIIGLIPEEDWAMGFLNKSYDNFDTFCQLILEEGTLIVYNIRSCLIRNLNLEKNTKFGCQFGSGGLNKLPKLVRRLENFSENFYNDDQFDLPHPNPIKVSNPIEIIKKEKSKSNENNLIHDPFVYKVKSTSIKSIDSYEETPKDNISEKFDDIKIENNEIQSAIPIIQESVNAIENESNIIQKTIENEDKEQKYKNSIPSQLSKDKGNTENDKLKEIYCQKIGKQYKINKLDLFEIPFHF